MKKLLLPLRHVSCFHPISCYHSLFIFFAFFCHYHYKSFMAEQPVMEFTDWNESIYFQIMMDAKKIIKCFLIHYFNSLKEKISNFQTLSKGGLIFRYLNFITQSSHQGIDLETKIFFKAQLLCLVFTSTIKLV